MNVPKPECRTRTASNMNISDTLIKPNPVGDLVYQEHKSYHKSNNITLSGRTLGGGLAPALEALAVHLRASARCASFAPNWNSRPAPFFWKQRKSQNPLLDYPNAPDPATNIQRQQTSSSCLHFLRTQKLSQTFPPHSALPT